MPYFVVSFYTTSDAMHCEYLMKREGVKGRLIPVPRELSAGCGIAFASESSLKGRVLSILEAEDVEVEDSATMSI